MAPRSVSACEIWRGGERGGDGVRERVRLRDFSRVAGGRCGVRGANAPRLLRWRIRLRGVSDGARWRSGAGGANALRLPIIAAAIR
jgi:hypothetical protein